MEEFKYIILILVYRNVWDLLECIHSIYDKIPSCKVIVVNAYYDEESCKIVKKVAEDNKCDFINIENKGYSYGNNVGIRFALEHYRFKYIIVSNPDIIVREFHDATVDNYDVIAPDIITKDGNKQNPMLVVENRFSEYLIYISMKKNIKMFFLIGVGINGVLRKLYLKYIKIIKRHFGKIYMAHGSFVIISERAIKMLEPVYDENMFLFAEEAVLAYKAKLLGIQIYYNDNIKVLHKEDGSMKMGNFIINNELKKSNVYFFEHYRKK